MELILLRLKRKRC